MSYPVTFGLINTFGNPDRWYEPWQQRYDGILEQIEWIDRELPIDGIYVTEHHFYDDGYLPSSLVMCAAIAARTRRVAVGTNLVQLPLHHPVRLAEDALVVDAISGGRLRLGLGMGYYHQEFDGLSVSLKERVKRTEEGLTILRAAFAGKPFSHQGRMFNLPEIRVTPLWMGAFVPAAVERAARLADGFLAFDLNTVSQYVDACERLGRPREDQRINCTYWAIIAKDPERAFAVAGENWLHLLNQYIVRNAYPTITETYDDPVKAMNDGLVMLADGPTAIAEFNRAIAEGAVDINLVALMPGEDLNAGAERMEYLGRHVIPHLNQSDHPAAGPTNSGVMVSA